MVDPTLQAFLLLLQVLYHIVFFDVGLNLAILPLMDLHLHVPMKEQFDDILQSFLNAIALHDTLHAADLILCLLLLQPILTHQPFISLAQVINDLFDGAVLLMQIRPQQVEHFLILLIGDAPSFVFKLIVLSQ